MEMTPAVIAALIMNYGLPFADWLIGLYHSKAKGEPVTAEEWAYGKTLVQTPETVLNNAVKVSGLPTDAPIVQSVTELIR